MLRVIDERTARPGDDLLSVVIHGELPDQDPPRLDATEVAVSRITEREALRSKAGAFVTLNHKGLEAGDPGRLRACMGVTEARQPLSEAVMQAAVWAAQDPRFPRLRASELGGLEVEVSVLSPAVPVACRRVARATSARDRRSSRPPRGSGAGG